jgi:hypothetical protein
MLIKSHVNFEDIPTFPTTKMKTDIEFYENLQLDSELADVLGANDVRMEQIKGQILLLKTF